MSEQAETQITTTDINKEIAQFEKIQPDKKSEEIEIGGKKYIKISESKKHEAPGFYMSSIKTTIKPENMSLAESDKPRGGGRNIGHFFGGDDLWTIDLFRRPGMIFDDIAAVEPKNERISIWIFIILVIILIIIVLRPNIHMEKLADYKLENWNQ